MLLHSTGLGRRPRGILFDGNDVLVCHRPVNASTYHSVNPFGLTAHLGVLKRTAGAPTTAFARAHQHQVTPS